MHLARKAFHASGIVIVALYRVLDVSRDWASWALVVLVAALAVLDVARSRLPAIQAVFETSFRAILDAKDMRGWTPLFVANGVSHGDVFKQQPQTAQLLEKLMTARGLSTEGQVADGTECLDCIQTHPDQAKAALERDVRMEAEFAAENARRTGGSR